MKIRITGGGARGRQLRVLEGPVRPTQDRVRAAIFSMLVGRLSGARVLDLYAGTGVLGLEAWSRGASSVTWVEHERRTYANLCANVEALTGGGTGFICVCGDVMRFLTGHLRCSVDMFDLVFADPPYAKSASEIKKLLPTLAQGSILAADAWLVLEQASELKPVAEPAWELIRDRRYGETRICIYRRSGAKE